MSMPSPIWIEQDQALAACCQRWLTLPILALDTEFERTHTYYPRPGLIQVYDGEGIYLLDPLALTDMTPFNGVLERTDIVKVLHSGSEDIELFIFRLGASPQGIFDTQVAAAYAGLDTGMGYQRLLEQLLNVSPAKEETRSDWLQRPLTEAQCHYAAEDVYWLYQVYQILQQQLADKQRLHWVLEDGASLVSQIADSFAPDHYYSRIKQAWQLNPRELAILRDLASWREREARQRDVARNQVMSDIVLWQVARTKPRSTAALSQVEGMRPHWLKKATPYVLAIIEAALELPPEALPARLPKPLSRAAQGRLRQLRTVINRVASEQQVPAELLARKKDLEWLIRHPQALADLAAWPGGLHGWRQVMLAPAITSLEFN